MAIAPRRSHEAKAGRLQNPMGDSGFSVGFVIDHTRINAEGRFKRVD
jgi:hypothetical protein